MTCESEVKVKVKIAQLCLTLCDPIDYTVHGILQTRILEWVAFPFFRESSQPRDWTQVSGVAGGFFTSWATREAQEIWSGSLSLLQWIFLAQESNRGLLHCRLIIYQLSYKGSMESINTLYTFSSVIKDTPQRVLANMKSFKSSIWNVKVHSLCVSASHTSLRNRNTRSALCFATPLLILPWPMSTFSSYFQGKPCVCS